MTKDCTEEFKKLSNKIALFWLVEIGYLVFVVFAFEATEELIKWGSLEFYIFIASLSLLMFMVLRWFSPRCPNCGQGLYSVIEINKYPIMVKSFIGKNCGGCGAKLKT
ncbi:MAG: hypothetical protein AseanaTS_03790 [Candidatus Pelagadaptatus aseana]